MVTIKRVSSRELTTNFGDILQALQRGVLDEVVVEGYPEIYLSKKSSIPPRQPAYETDEWGNRINKGYDDSDFY